MEFVCFYDSPLGGIVMTSDGTALTGLWFQGQRVHPRMPEPCAETRDLPVFQQTARWLDLYFRGEVPDFTPPLALRGTAFRRTVWALLLDIPCGRTVTYGELAARTAARLGRSAMSAQAVGGAVGHNPVSLIVPCHRVVGADGGLTGYAGGLDRKRCLLELEAGGRAPDSRDKEL